MRFYLALVLSAVLFQTSCNKKSDDGHSSGSSDGSIRGQIIVDQQTCGTNVANINVGGAQTYSRQVFSGGSFDIPVASGTYTLSAQAGGCYVQAQNVGPVTGGQSPYRICLTTNAYFCQQNGYYKMAASTAVSSSVQAKSSGASTMQSCSWISYGCNAATFPGTGTAVTVNRSLYFYPSQNVNDVTVSQKLKSEKSKNIFASPSLGTKGWVFNAGVGSTMVAEKVNYDYFTVDTQFDHAVLQNTSGTCVAKSEMLNWISKYLKDQGFQAKSISNFVERNKSEVPPNEKICIYPQTFTQTDQVAEYESSEPLEMKRVWFLIIPELHTEVMKLRMQNQTMKAWFTKPKSDAIAALKTEGMMKPTMLEGKGNNQTRSVANKYYLPTEEVALVFLLEN